MWTHIINTYFICILLNLSDACAQLFFYFRSHPSECDPLQHVRVRLLIFSHRIPIEHITYVRSRPLTTLVVFLPSARHGSPIDWQTVWIRCRFHPFAIRRAPTAECYSAYPYDMYLFESARADNVPLCVSTACSTKSTLPRLRVNDDRVIGLPCKLFFNIETNRN